MNWTKARWNHLRALVQGAQTEPADRELDISPVLKECFVRTETYCVRACCGLDAFEPDAGVIRAWASEVGQRATSDALSEVQGLLVLANDRSMVVSSRFLNARTPDEASRERLLSFLKAYHTSLAACA